MTGLPNIDLKVRHKRELMTDMQEPGQQEPAQQAAPSAPRLFSGARREWKFVLKFLAVSIVFLLVEFSYQFLVLIPGEFGGSLVRAYGLAGATFLSLALLTSPLFKWKPAWVRYWHVRRSLGVMGTVFILLHVLAVVNFYFSGDVLSVFWSLNPFENALLFGVLGIVVFFLMTITSTDWAVGKMGYHRWKALHRLVYVGFLAGVLHFLTINPELLMNPAGYALIGVTFLSLVGELFWFIKTLRQKGSSGKGIAAGIVMVVLWLLAGYYLLAV